MRYEHLAKNHVLRALSRPASVIFERAEGSRLWDIHGKEYLDTMSGSAGPAMVGHANAEVAAAVARQMARLPSNNILHLSTTVIEFCSRLSQLAPAGLSKTFLCAGGGEAIEAAVKLAFRVTGRAGVVSLSGGYHGMSLGAMSLTGMPALTNWMPRGAYWPTFRQVGSPDRDQWRQALEALENEFNGPSEGAVAALVMEVVQGPNGHIVFPSEYYRGVQKICREHGVLLIIDEIQTGLARCGTRWACDLFDIRPDILAAGKALGGGVPIGAVLTSPELIPDGMEAEPWHILTFMNQPLAAAAGLAVLEIVERDRLADRARTLGQQASDRFCELARTFEVIGDVHGPGLFVGIEFVESRETRTPATAACRSAWDYCMELGLIAQFGGIAGNIFKFKPPLTTSPSEFERMLDIISDVARYIQMQVDRDTASASARNN